MPLDRPAAKARCHTRGAGRRPAGRWWEEWDGSWAACEQTGNATLRQHNASRLKLEAKFQAPRSCCKDVRVVSVTHMREVRLHVGNPSVPAIPSSDPHQNSARTFGHCSRYGQLPVHVACTSGTCTMLELIQSGKCKIEKRTKSSMQTSPNSGPCGSGRSGNRSESVRSTPASVSNFKYCDRVRVTIITSTMQFAIATVSFNVTSRSAQVRFALSLQVVGIDIVRGIVVKVVQPGSRHARSNDLGVNPQCL